MQLSKVFTERFIRVGLTSTNKHELFEELVHALAGENDEIESDEVLRTLWVREEMLNTRIAPGIAIPHTQVKHIHKTMGIFGVAPAGIDYELPDGEKVKLVVLLVDHETATIEHLDTLRNFAIMARNSRFVQQVLDCKDAKSVVEVIKMYESFTK
jgi:PTS system fructose-specific IIA component/PTS system nitrogen regulatory IIA component